ncbi:hypothetical protein AYO44_12425 [Planctomycetaceae bacterium SCGC AG-212-F19]|nr:hypothetical protein AYO44_12425 [Planctomycetaceae bacterium SCGC AG-212-F19]
MRSQAGSIVLVDNELTSLDGSGGMDTSNCLLARLLASHGWKVHILHCGKAADRELDAKVRAQLNQSDIGFIHLEDLPIPLPLQLPGDSDAHAHRSERVRRALEELFQTFPFDLVQFAERQGLGFRTLQAKRAGTAFANTGIVVKVHGMSQWMRCNACTYPRHHDELMLDFYERRSFEEADFPIAVSRSLLDYARSIAWKVRDEVQVVADARARPTTANVDQHNGSIVQFYMDCLDKVRSARRADQALSARGLPWVTVAVSHYNLGAYLPEALASLAAQTYPNSEVLVIDDGSTDPQSRRVFAAQQRFYPQFRFAAQNNTGAATTYNRLLAEARGEFFLPFDADNVAAPSMIEQFVGALTRNPDHAAMVSYILRFSEGADPVSAQCHAAYRPPGGPHIMGCLGNVYGDSCGLYRTEALRAVGGWDPHPDNEWEDWHCYVRLVNRGYLVGVVPEYLFYYRVRPTSRCNSANRYRSRQYIFGAFVREARLSEADWIALWSALVGWDHQLQLNHAQPAALPLRYLLADRMNRWLQRVPLMHRFGKKTILSAWNAWRALASRPHPPAFAEKITGRAA